MSQIWTKDAIIQRLYEINHKGFISIPEGMFRNDDGIVGQILEREFGVNENNLHLADLGTFELKGMRNKKNKPNMLTLFHQTSSEGLTPIQIFQRFGYVRQSKRSGIMKKKLFTTVNGKKENSLQFILKPFNENEFMLYHNDEYLASWDLTPALPKIEKVILAFADTIGKTNSIDEQFKYTAAYLLSEPYNLSQAIIAGAVVMDLCIDQPIDGSKGVHDRGPHIRIPISKLGYLFKNVERLL